MSVGAPASTDVAAAVAIVMRENACDAQAAVKLMRERGGALGLSIDEVATTIVQIAQP